MRCTARVRRLEQAARDRPRLTETEAIQSLRQALRAIGTAAPMDGCVLPDLHGTRAGAFLAAVGEAGRCTE